jgi:hypothetical protein
MIVAPRSGAALPCLRIGPLERTMPDTQSKIAVPLFPGAVIRRNSPHRAAVEAVQTRLNALGMGALPVNGLFDDATDAAVRRFQGLFLDLKGNPLTVDGEVGEITWGALFGAAALPKIVTGGALAKATLDMARSQIGVSEQPSGSNRGKEVEAFLQSVGLGGGNPWCAAFVHWCAEQAAAKIGQPNPVPRTGGVLEMWRRARKAGLPLVEASAAVAQPALVKSGMVFIMQFSATTGHTGFVEDRDGGRLVTIEGNSNDGGSRDGTGVFRLGRRTLGSPQMLGFFEIP